MATNKVCITAGLAVSKTSTTVPAAGVNTVYVTAGLAPVIYTPAAAGGPFPHYIAAAMCGGMKG